MNRLLKDRALLELAVLFEELKRREIKTGEIPTEQIETIPLSQFDQDLGPLESLVFYLHHTKKQPIEKISRKLLRHYQTIWATYRAVEKKPKVEYPLTQPEKKILENLNFASKADIIIPLNIFYNRKLSIFESLVKYLRENLNLNYHKMGVLLHRDERTIWTIYHRASKKLI